MSHTFSLPCGENAVPHQSTVETPTATLFLRDFCTPPFVDSLKPDVGLRAFARLPEREHQLLRTIAERPDSILTLAYTQQGVIVGQVTLVPAEDSWQGLTNTYEIAFEVSAGWRRSGIMRQLLKQVFELDCLEDLIIIGMGLSWHWDTTGLGMTRFAYRAMIERLGAHRTDFSRLRRRGGRHVAGVPLLHSAGQRRFALLVGVAGRMRDHEGTLSAIHR